MTLQQEFLAQLERKSALTRGIRILLMIIDEGLLIIVPAVVGLTALDYLSSSNRRMTTKNAAATALNTNTAIR